MNLDLNMLLGTHRCRETECTQNTVKIMEDLVLPGVMVCVHNPSTEEEAEAGEWQVEPYYIMKPYLKNSNLLNLGTHQAGRSVLEVELYPFSLEVTQYGACSSFMSIDVINYDKKHHRGERVYFTSQFQVPVPYCAAGHILWAIVSREKWMCACSLAHSLLCPLLFGLSLRSSPSPALA